MYKLFKQEGRARRGEFHTPHGVIQAPFFMNVGTSAAIKGGISTDVFKKELGPEVTKDFFDRVFFGTLR